MKSLIGLFSFLEGRHLENPSEPAMSSGPQIWFEEYFLHVIQSGLYVGR